MKKEPKPLPSAPKAWLKEIAAAYLDAEEAIPFGSAAGVTITKKDLFHLAPEVCLKFRGLERSMKNTEKTTEAALSSYVVMQEAEPDTNQGTRRWRLRSVTLRVISGWGLWTAKRRPAYWNMLRNICRS